MTEKAAILVIYTGGTIGMIQDQQGTLHPFDFDHMTKQLPALENCPFTVSAHVMDPVIDSSDMRPEFWIRLAGVIEDNYENYEGFVILHGSDTMAYSASVLSFMLENLNKPVVFTGSQLPLGVLRTDGRENFITALEIAAAYDDEQTPLVPEVSLYFENQLFRGNRSSKLNSENFSAFYSGNYPVLAEVGVHIKYRKENILRPNFKKLKVHKKLDSNIAILKLFPGLNEEVVKATFAAKGLKAIILETFGAGNAPTDEWLIQHIGKAVERGIIVLNVSQCKGGTVKHGLYAASMGLEKAGVISGGDINTEAALGKLMYLLGEGYTHDKLKRLLQKSLRGEMSR